MKLSVEEKKLDENKVCINTYHQVFIPDFIETTIFKKMRKKFLKKNPFIKKIEIKKEEGKYCFYFIPKDKDKNFISKDKISDILNFMIEIKEVIKNYFSHEESYDDLKIRGYIYELFFYNSTDSNYSILIDTTNIQEINSQLPVDIYLYGKIILVSNDNNSIKIDNGLYLVRFPVYVVLSFECDYYEDKELLITKEELERVMKYFNKRKEERRSRE